MRLALLGYGKMGRAVEGAALARGHEVAVRLGSENRGGSAITAEAMRGVDVTVDFSVPGAVLDNVRAVTALGLDMVVGTTGWYDRLDEARRLVEEAGTGLIWAPNFSLGVHLFARMVRRAAELADSVEEYDVHLHESHHRHKVDHPSGTARRLADILVEELARKARWAKGPPEGAPEADVLWVTSARAGEIPGTHMVGIEGPDDSIALRHEARGRVGFARGAVTAAEWVRGRPGFHGIDDLLAQHFGDTA